MKKVNVIKTLIAACIMAFAAILPLGLTACHESNGDINLKMNYKI